MVFSYTLDCADGECVLLVSSVIENYASELLMIKNNAYGLFE